MFVGLLLDEKQEQGIILMGIFLEDSYRLIARRKIDAIRIFRDLGYRYVFYLRMCQKGGAWKAIFVIPRKHLSRSCGLEISPNTNIGPGLYIGHPYGITINTGSVLGKNVNIHKGCTIGQENRGKRKGAPTIGNCVSIGINATIVGSISVGDDVLIAANSFVNCDIPSHSIVLGNPCIVIPKINATESYIINRV